MGYTKEYLEWALEKFGEEGEDLDDFLERFDGGNFERMREFTRDRLAEVVERERDTPPRWDAFISYAGEHQDLAVPLAQELRKLGLKIWFDHDEYPKSDEWNGILYRYIHEGIALARTGIVIVSPEYVKKDWTTEEYHGLRLKGAPRLFFILHKSDVETLASLDPELATKINEAGVGLASTAESSIQELARQIADFIQKTAPEDQIPNESLNPSRTTSAD